MNISMSQENIVENNGFLHIKELKERVKSLVSEVDLNGENTKFKHDKNVDFNLIDSTSTDENDDEFLDCTEIESRSETDWLLEEDNVGESVKDICSLIYSDLDENRPEVTYLFRQLESAQQPESYILSSQKPSIDSRTFTRPKKCSTRPPLTSVINSEEGRPKLQRRLTTTISPSPNLVSKLEELSKNNNRPVSGNYNHVEWEGGSEESLAEIKTPVSRTKRQSLPASLFDRLQELKKANSSIKIPNIVEQEPLNGQMVFEKERNHLLEDAKKVTEALDVNFKNSHSSRLSEIFRNTQDYYSDDNESFISLDEVSGFCDRLTLSTDQNTYSSIVREMEQNEICLFHRPLKGDKAKDSRMTFGGIETPQGNLPKNIIVNEEEADLNQKYEIDEELNNLSINTFDRNLGNFSKEHRRNTTYDAPKKPGLVDVIVKNLSPNNNSMKSMNSNDTGSNYNNSNNNNNNNNNININNRVLARHCGSNLMNYTYQKPNNTLDQNALNALHGEKYSTKIFDSSFGKGESEPQKSVVRRSNGKRDQSDHSEDDCMSTTSDQSSRSVDSNSEPKLMGEIRNVAVQKRKILSSTPVTSQMAKINFDKFDVVSPIKTQMGDGESRAYSNPSSRGQSPRRGQPAAQREGIQKYRTPNLRQSLKVPQRELKLKPALIRPSQNFKRPLSYARTSSEPSVPQKVETFQPVASVPALRPLGPAAVPSLTNVRPSNRVSGIPRPPTRLKQPQIRLENLQRK